MHVHLQVGIELVQLPAHILGELDGGHGEGLVGPLGLHLEGPGGGEPVPQVFLGGLEHGVLVLGARPGPGEAHHAEETLHGLIGPVQIAGILLGLHIQGGLLGVHPELAEGPQAALGVSDELVLKAAAVEALEHDLAQLEQNDFIHGW